MTHLLFPPLKFYYLIVILHLDIIFDSFLWNTFTIMIMSVDGMNFALNTLVLVSTLGRRLIL